MVYAFKKFNPGLLLILLFAFLKLSFHLMTNDLWSFHRDEFLYLALGRNLDWGYWSNAPFTGFLSFIAQWVFGGSDGISVAYLRFFPALFSTGVMVLVLLLVREMSGKNPAIIIAGISMMMCPGFLRPGMMFMPVIFEIFFWTLYSWIIIKYLNSGKKQYLLWLGFALGIGLLNKYSTIFYVFGILVGMLLTKHRNLFQSKTFYIAVGITLLTFLPNLIWQYSNGFPVFFHMSELRNSQLVNVSLSSFIFDQILMCLPALFVWLSGIYFFFVNPNARNFTILGWIFLSIIAILILLNGKGYYTLGIYPLLVAAGATQLDKIFEIKKWRWLWFILIIKALIIGAVLMPFSAPVIPQDKMIAYCNASKEKGLDVPMRWEDGQIHDLPQDYADMLGWEELAEIVRKTYLENDLNAQNTLVYAEDYGEGGSVDHFNQDILEIVSFSDSYRLWVKDTIPNTVVNLVYINDELGEDVEALFESIEIAGSIQNPLARERGTSVYLCQKPRSSFKEFWEGRVQEVKDYYGLE